MKVFIKLFILVCLLTIAENSNAQNVGNSDHLIEEMRIVEINPEDFEDEYEHAMNSDNLESINRAIFSFNMTIDDYFLKPVARGYRFITHDWIQARVLDFFNNLDEPRNFANALLQGDIEGTFRGFWRFVVNSFIGVGGIYDVAAGFGLVEREKDFSQTLAFYGIGSGDYLVLPFLGPSTLRDTGGFAADNFLNAAFFVDGYATAGMVSANVVSQREALLDITDSIEEEAFDLYSAYKSNFLQNRKRRMLSNL